MANAKKKDGRGRPKAQKPLGIQVAVRLDRSLKERLDARGAELDRPAAWVIRKAIEQFLGDDGKS